MRKVIVAVMLLATAGAAHAQQSQDTSLAANAPRSVRLPGGTVEVPLLMLGRAPGQLPVVEVMVNGHGPYRFGIETGAPFIGIRPGLADSIGLHRSADMEELPAYHVDSLTIGRATLVDVRVAEVRTAATDIDGFLGLPTFRDFMLTVDYPGLRVTMSRDSLPGANGQDVIALRRMSDNPFLAIPITIGGTTFDAILDTRSTGGVQLTPTSAANVKFNGDLVVVGMARGAAIAPTEVKAGTLADDVHLGKYVITAPEVGVRPLPEGFPTAPLLGTQVLQKFAFSIDQRHGRVRFTRADTTPIELPRRRAPGGGG